MGTTTSHTVSSLTNGTSYSFKVRAVNSVGAGTAATASATPAAVPGTPGSFTATPGDGQVELSWTAPANNGAAIAKYQVQQDSGSWNDVGTTTSHTVSSLTNGNTYSFKVRAVNSVGAGTPATASATPAAVPGTPGSFTATPGDGQVELSWTAPASNGAAIAKYQVQQDSGSWNDVTGTSHTVSSLTNGTSYSFKVRAVNSVGAGTPERPPPLPQHPQASQELPAASPQPPETDRSNSHGRPRRTTARPSAATRSSARPAPGSTRTYPRASRQAQPATRTRASRRQRRTRTACGR